MGRAEFAGEGELVLDGVDGDDLARAGDPRALNGGEADAARAVDGDCRAGLDGGGVERCAGAGHHAAADQRGLVERHVVAHMDERVFVDERVLSVGGEVGELGDGLAVPGEAGVFVGAALHLGAAAQVGASAEAVFAVAAEDGEAHDHVVAGAEVLHQRADLGDDAGGFVSQNAGRLEGVEAVDEMEVGVADAGGGGLDQHLARAGVVDIDAFDGQILVRPVEHSGFHGGHGESLPVGARPRGLRPKCCAQSSRVRAACGRCRQAVGAGRGTRTPTALGPADFKSTASTRFAIPAS